MNNLTLPTNDIQRLEPLLMRLETSDEWSANSHLGLLSKKLADCRETDPQHVPADVVTMNSRVRIREAGRPRELEYTLVFPSEANPPESRISVLTPVGAALLGSRVGKKAHIVTPKGSRKILVVQLVFQPESAGRYDL